MNQKSLIETARLLVTPGKGLLAMDESSPTCNKRFASRGIPQTEEARRSYRQLIVTTSGLGEFISGAILYDETVRQRTDDGTAFTDVLARAGILFGIKVDRGAKPLAGFPGETVTEGLDGLRERLGEYAGMGARFAKWRAVIAIGDGLPTAACIEVNAHALARYAALCQEAGIVPVVEPEVLMEGNHSLARCGEVTERLQHAVFEQCVAQGVLLEGMLLKPNMVLPGNESTDRPSAECVAEATITCLRRTVPPAVPGVMFLSGGQPADAASVRLNVMNLRGTRHLPWTVAFSFARAIQQPALDLWRGDPANVPAAQAALLRRARLNGLACRGLYLPSMEQADAPTGKASPQKASPEKAPPEKPSPAQPLATV
jgi:fructose-bisphosphate aldolase class I